MDGPHTPSKTDYFAQYLTFFSIFSALGRVNSVFIKYHDMCEKFSIFLLLIDSRCLKHLPLFHGTDGSKNDVAKFVICVTNLIPRHASSTAGVLDEGIRPGLPIPH